MRDAENIKKLIKKNNNRTRAKKVVPEEKKFNELNGKKWTRYSVSVWEDIIRNAEERKPEHPAVFPIELAKRVLEIFTKKGDWVLDPFLGTGATLLAAKSLGRNAIGIEIVGEYVKVAEKRLAKAENLFEIDENTRIKIIKGDARELTDHIKPASVDFVFTSPPYWDILTQKRTADGKPVKDYKLEYGNLGLIKSYEIFLNGLTQAFEKVFSVLKHGKFTVVNVMDLRKKDKFYPYHVDVIKILEDIGFILDDIIIWNRAREYSNLRPLGYPYRFRVNKVHEYLIIFEKPRER